MKTGKIPQLREFRLQLIREIIQEHAKDLGTGRRTSAGEHPKRLIDRHFPSLVPSETGKRAKQRKCIVCSQSVRKERKRSESRFECAECDVGLCITDCFKEYHTLTHF